jgi:hypothetical protein
MKENLNMKVRITIFSFLFNINIPFYIVMQRAWRERTPSIRIQLAHDALEKNSE